jgi:hypothetical protein
MEVQYFFEERTTFLRYYYDQAGGPFLKVQKQIEAKEKPYDKDSGDPDEPPYLEEWSAAADALSLLGRSCISMLSATLKLYFMEWSAELGFRPAKKKSRDDGWIGSYRTAFEEKLKHNWDICHVDLSILEQIEMVRNHDQHPRKITTLNVYHEKRDFKKYPDPFFLSEVGRKELAENPDGDGVFMFANEVSVTRDKLFRAIDECERLVDWLEPQLMTAKYGNPTGFPIRQ